MTDGQPSLGALIRVHSDFVSGHAVCGGQRAAFRHQSSRATLFQAVLTVKTLIVIIIRIVPHKLSWLLEILLSVSHLPRGMLGLQVGVLLKLGFTQFWD